MKSYKLRAYYAAFDDGRGVPITRYIAGPRGATGARGARGPTGKCRCLNGAIIADISAVDGKTISYAEYSSSGRCFLAYKDGEIIVEKSGVCSVNYGIYGGQSENKVQFYLTLNGEKMDATVREITGTSANSSSYTFGVKKGDIISVKTSNSRGIYGGVIHFSAILFAFDKQ